MLTKETIEQALPFIEESWWLMCDASAEDWELKDPIFHVRQDHYYMTVGFTWDYGEDKYSSNPDTKKISTIFEFEIHPNESIRKLVKEVHDALEHIMKEPYDYYLEED